MAKTNRTEMVCFRLSPEERQLLRTLCDREHRSMANQLVYMTKQALAGDAKSEATR